MINGTCLQNAIISGANNIAKNKTSVDELNIFPVPDGDTGTNMSMTMLAAARELENLNNNKVGEVASVVASSLLRGARGNSGVILSLLYRGFAKGLAGLDSADGVALVEALGIGVEAAYKAVMKPTEGTILTVARVAYEKGKAAAAANNDAVYVWNAVCQGAKDALVTTPELLPVLKKAGVVDAGGKGLCIIFDGMMSVFQDGYIITNDTAQGSSQSEGQSDAFRNAAAEFDEDITFTYCTEFIVGRDTEVTTSPLELRSFLETIGDCVVVVDDEEIIKVHVHTEDPGKALQRAIHFGQLLTVKVENMKEQHRKAAEANKKAKAEAEKVSALMPVEPTDEVGFVSVAAGEGLKGLFTDLGCTHVVSGGQTMNPSTEDILAAVLATPAKVVYVLPNNKNIIMAAEQTVPLAVDRKVIVIPTRTIPQGLAAMLAYDPDLSSAEEIAKIMTEASNKVSTGQVTFAARDSEYGGFKIKEGEILALQNGKLTFLEKDPVKAIVRLARSMVARDTSFITLIYGADITEEQAEDAKKAIQAKVGNHTDITLVSGGQPIYYFIVSVE